MNWYQEITLQSFQILIRKVTYIEEKVMVAICGSAIKLPHLCK